MDTRFKKINRILTNYATGNFKQKIRPSNKFDEVDAFIECVNMLGEELKETTISKNHFNNIFNSVSDMIFVLDENGKIQNTSQSVHTVLGLDWMYCKNKSIDSFVAKNSASIFTYFKKKLQNNNKPVEVEAGFKNVLRKTIPTICTAVYLFNEKRKKIGYLLVVKNLTDIKQYEFFLNQSEEKFKKIFEASSDCIFTFNTKGEFFDINTAGKKMLGGAKKQFEKNNLFHLFNKPTEKKEFTTLLKEGKNIINFQAQIKNTNDVLLDCLLSITPIKNEENKLHRYQGIIKDISKQRQTEKLILKTVLNTQENERQRFARDIHDSLGQKLSAIKFYIGTTVASTNEAESKKILTKANDALLTTINEMRNICFNLMPKTLESFGLAASIKELCNQVELQNKLTLLLKASPSFPSLNKQLEISVFRIVQEFINNSLKHGKANKIEISLKNTHSFCKIIIKDNGVGFNIGEGHRKNGLGLRNVQSRIIPYNGEAKIISSIGKGVKYEILLPLIKSNISSTDG